MVVPGNIEHYPELFEPFRLQLEQIRSSFTPDVDLVTATHSTSSDIAGGDLDTEVISNAASSIHVPLPSSEVTPVDSDTVSNSFDWVEDFLQGLFG